MLRLNPAKQETVAPTISALPVPIATVEPLDARIEAYLDRVESTMTALPPQERVERRCELRQHLDATRSALEELGNSPDSSVTEALHRLGEPETIARHFNRAWTQTRKRVESPWPAMRLGLRWFGGAFSAFLAGSVLATFCGHPLWIDTQGCAVGLVLTPCVLGMMFGTRVPKRAGIGAFYALAALAVSSLPVVFWAPSSLTLSLVIPAFGIFACWIPVVCLSATLTSRAMRAHQARRHFRM
jgi:hypothetical protein